MKKLIVWLIIVLKYGHDDEYTFSSLFCLNMRCLFKLFCIVLLQKTRFYHLGIFYSMLYVRFGGVVVITSASHAEGLGFEPRSNLFFFPFFFLHPRVGLMGNPSDQFNGKSMALSIKNFWAEVTITPSTRLVCTVCIMFRNNPSMYNSFTETPFTSIE